MKATIATQPKLPRFAVTLRHGGFHQHKTTKRNRSRADQKRRAIAESV